MIPDALPEEPLEESCSSELQYTIQGLCNESTLTRAEILGVLEAVKLSLFMSWA